MVDNILNLAAAGATDRAMTEASKTSFVVLWFSSDNDSQIRGPFPDRGAAEAWVNAARKNSPAGTMGCIYELQQPEAA